MATVQFRIKGKMNPANIKIRFKNGDKFDFELATGLKTKIEHWSSSKQKVKNIAIANYKDDVNNNLNALRTFVENQYFISITNNEEITSKWLKNKINIYFERPTNKIDNSKIYLVDFIEKCILQSRKLTNRNKAISESTISNYAVTKNKLLQFESFTNRKIKFKNIDLSFHEDFLDYLYNKQSLSDNSVGHYIGKIKVFCNKALAEGIKVNPDFNSRNFYAPSKETVDVYLNQKEIDTIFNLELNSDGMLDNARDWFIIGLWTGLRVSDFLFLTKESVVNGLISIKNKKTDIKVIIPVHPQVNSILKKRNNNFPRKISDVKFNKYIKDVCRLAEINNITNGFKMSPIKVNNEIIYRKLKGKYPKYELISSHVCRRSFATNLYGKLDTLTIMNITGHKTEKSFLSYIKITPKEHAHKLRDFWNRNIRN